MAINPGTWEQVHVKYEQPIEFYFRPMIVEPYERSIKSDDDTHYAADPTIVMWFLSYSIVQRLNQIQISRANLLQWT